MTNITTNTDPSDIDFPPPDGWGSTPGTWDICCWLDLFGHWQADVVTSRPPSGWNATAVRQFVESRDDRDPPLFGNAIPPDVDWERVAVEYERFCIDF